MSALASIRRIESARLLSAFWAASPGLTALVVAAGLLAGALLPAFALATGWLIGAVGDGGATGWAVATLIAIFGLARLIDPVQEEAGQALWRRVDEWLSQRLMRAVLDPPGLAAVESPTVRDRLSQAQGELTDLTPGQAAYHLGRVLALVVQGAGSLLLIGLHRWWLAVLLAVGYWVAYRAYRDHWHHITLVLYGRTNRLRGAYYLRSVALEPAAAKETRVFGLAGWLVDGYRRRWLGEMRDIWRTRREGWVLSVLVMAGLAVAEGATIGLVVLDAGGGVIPVSRAVVLVQAVLGAAVLGVYTEGHWLLSECVRAIDRVGEVEAEGAGAAIVAGGRSDVGDAPRRLIRFEGVGFAYPGSDRPVFEGLDLEIEAGRSLAIVGDNGAGKTTLIKLLCRLYDPQHGRITIDGVDLRELDPASWRRRVAAVFQDFVQFELSAFDNVSYGAIANRHDTAGVADAAALAGAGPVVARLSQGWSTPLSRSFTDGTQLSGGEWQRLALARALFAIRSGAGLLILDEPTAALDARGEAEVYERFLDLTRGTTSLVISHRFSTVRRADRIVVIEDGLVVEDGTHDELVERGGRYAHRYRLQASRFDPGQRRRA